MSTTTDRIESIEGLAGPFKRDVIHEKRLLAAAVAAGRRRGDALSLHDCECLHATTATVQPLRAPLSQPHNLNAQMSACASVFMASFKLDVLHLYP